MSKLCEGGDGLCPNEAEDDGVCDEHSEQVLVDCGWRELRNRGPWSPPITPLSVQAVRPIWRRR